MPYEFPLSAAVTGKRPDLVLWSESLRVVLLIELTVPAEKNVRAASTRKRERYQGLAEACRERGYTTELLPVEVGVLGFVAHSMQVVCKRLGVWRGKLKRELEVVTLRCSYWMYLHFRSEDWTPGRLFRADRW